MEGSDVAVATGPMFYPCGRGRRWHPRVHGYGFCLTCVLFICFCVCFFFLVPSLWYFFLCHGCSEGVLIALRVASDEWFSSGVLRRALLQGSSAGVRFCPGSLPGSFTPVSSAEVLYTDVLRWVFCRGPSPGSSVSSGTGVGVCQNGWRRG